jgi:3-hydroxyisobutyrate dehydrogenase-like beta-hydroxyacid dehydrogenase
MNVGFLGLGTMGAAMAANVARAGHALAVWNRTAARAVPLASAGARRAETPRACADGADVVVLMLADPAAVDAVCAGPDGVLAALAPGALLVDMSTVDPATAHRTDAAARARGARYVDAPVSGTRKPAEDGTLVIMTGGDDADVERARPVLETMGRVVRCGAIGQGMAMKLVLNGLGAHMLTGFVSLLVLGARHGLPARTMLDVIGQGAFSSPLYAGKGARIVARDFRPDFSLALMLKDQELVLGAARELGVSLPALAAIRDVLAAAVDAGLGADDLSGLVRHFETIASTTVK